MNSLWKLEYRDNYCLYIINQILKYLKNEICSISIAWKLFLPSVKKNFNKRGAARDSSLFLGAATLRIFCICNITLPWIISPWPLPISLKSSYINKKKLKYKNIIFFKKKL